MTDAGTGSSHTRLIVLRGNSGSGKSATALGMRARLGRGLAIVGQDTLRRDILKERDVPGGINIGLIDVTARYALDHGYHVVVEGILDAGRYGEMLCGLVAAHRGVTRCFYFDVSFEETLRRHATKVKAAEFGEPEMRRWFRWRDYAPCLNEIIIPEQTGLDEAVAWVMREVGLSGER